MLAVERRARILDILRRDKIVKVESLSEEFGVSVMTIRRDLEKCEKEDLVNRCHGGAILKSEIIREPRYVDKELRETTAKEAIAAYAATLVHPGSIIFLDAGTTTMQLARKLAEVPDLTVTTNDLAIAHFMANVGARVVMLGGLVANSSGSTHGHLADDMLRELRMEIAFTGGQAINELFELFSATEAKVSFRRLLMRQANKVYLLVDETKFYKQSLYRVHSLEAYTGVITDKRVLDSERQYLSEHGINLITLTDETSGQSPQ